MAKRKIRKEPEKKSFQYGAELKGLFLILISLIGFGNFGIMGSLIKNFAVFMFGSWYAILLVLFLILGMYMVAKRKTPEMFSSRLIGLYTLLIAILLFSHMNYLKLEELKGMEIIKRTVDNIMVSINNAELLRETGGGIIGALFSSLFMTLFDAAGTTIVVVILAIFGIIMLLNITLSNFLKSLILPFKKLIIINKSKSKDKSKSNNHYPIEEKQNEEEIDNRIIISDINDLKQKENNNEEFIEEELTDNLENQLSNSSSNKEYVLPPLSLLSDSKKQSGKVNSNEYTTANSKIIERTLKEFDITAKVVEIHIGPSVTQFEIEIKSGTKVNKVLSINKELALALCARNIRIQAPIPGKSTIGIELANPVISEVKIKDVLSSLPKKTQDKLLLAPLGKDIMGNIQYFEINKTPHLLVAGATGSGKSVCINNIITSILIRTRPEDVKLVLVDPKKVELSMYEGVPHLYRPVVTDPKKAAVVLRKIVEEMEHRYDIFSDTKTKNITTYNEYVTKKINKGDTSIKKLPFIVVIIDELADLMLVAAKEVEDSIMRITQMARAAGIHLIVATQRPSTDVITGLIKANIPSRISFAVSSSIDSRTILDMTGAEKLLGKGDMLFLPMGENIPLRIQGSFISDEEVLKVVEFVSRNGKPEFNEKMLDTENNGVGSNKNLAYNGPEEYEDPLYNEIVEFAIQTRKVSASLLQRKYHLGYNRAARIIDLLEERGIIGASNGSKPREVLVKLEEKNKENE